MGRPSASARPAAAALTPPSARPGAPAPSAAASVGRTLRLPVFVGVTTVLGVAAHLAVEHSAPRPSLVALAVLAVSAISLLLRGRERSFEAIALALAAGQAVVHAVLCLCHSTSPSGAGRFVQDVLCHGGTGGHAGMGGGYLAHLYPGHTMLLAHVLAAGVAAWWLRQGEAAVWAAVGWVWPVLSTLPALVAVAVAPPLRPHHDTAVRTLRSQVVGLRAHPRRGPPARVLESRAPAFA